MPDRRDDPAVAPECLAGPPTAPVHVPVVVQTLAGERAAVPVWQNQLGGVTFRIGDRPDATFVKWQPAGSAVDLDAEVVRLRWLAPHTPVPVVVDHGEDDEGSWLVTLGVDAASAVDDRWRADPSTAAAALGRGLRSFHDAVPTDGCPFDWSVSARLAPAGNPSIGPVPDIDRLVVCHGDACVPNTLLHDDGTVAAHLDVGACGLADRWADLAVGSMSLGWNYGPGWEATYFEAYGVAPDPDRIDFYRRLWNAT